MGTASGNREEVLVLAKSAREGELIRRVAGEAGLVCTAAASVDDFCEAVRGGAAAMGVLAQEALAGEEIGKLAGAIERQPPGAELPLVIVVPRGALPPSALQAAAPDVRGLRTATLIERPLRAAILASALQAGVRLRRQQHELRDAQERERRLRQLQADHELLDLALAAGNIGIFEWRVDERRVTASPQLQRQVGLSSSSFDGTPEALAALLFPEDRERARGALEMAAAGTRDLDLEFRVAGTGDPVRWLHARGWRLPGEPNRIVGVAFDITERKRAAEQEREARLEQILEKIPVGVLLAEAPSGRLIFHNRRAAEILGRPLPQSAWGEEHAAWEPHRPDGTPYPVDESPMARTARSGEVSASRLKRCCARRDSAALRAGGHQRRGRFAV